MKKNHRRALSTVIGTFFFIVVMVGAFGAILAAMNIQTDLIDSQGAIAEIQIRRSQEDFSITPRCEPAFSNIMVVDVTNTGANHLEIVDVFIYDTANIYQILPNNVPLTPLLDDSLVPAGGTVDVLDGQPQGPFANGVYSIKVVTSLGNVRESSVTLPCPSTEAQIVNDDLIAKPAVYAAFPNPFAKAQGAADYGVFALIVANPTNISMTVMRASIQLVNPNNPAIIDTTCSNHTPLSPVGGTWYCDKEFVYWEDLTGTAVVVAAYDAVAFVIQLAPNSSIKKTAISSVSTNTYTSLGQFGNTKTDTIGTHDKKAAIPNIFMCVADPCGVNEFTYVRLALPEETLTNFYFTLENGGGDGDIEMGDLMIINVPADFGTINDLTLDVNFALAVPPVTMTDGSQHITVEVKNSVIGPHTQRTFGFSSTTPSVDSTIMYILLLLLKTLTNQQMLLR